MKVHCIVFRFLNHPLLSLDLDKLESASLELFENTFQSGEIWNCHWDGVVWMAERELFENFGVAKSNLVQVHIKHACSTLLFWKGRVRLDGRMNQRKKLSLKFEWISVNEKRFFFPFSGLKHHFQNLSRLVWMECKPNDQYFNDHHSSLCNWSSCFFVFVFCILCTSTGLATHELHFTIIREEFKPNQKRPCEICGQIGKNYWSALLISVLKGRRSKCGDRL